MNSICSGKSIVRLALAWTLLVVVPACQAQSAPNLDKHARKIEKRLTKYPAGAYVNVALRDGSQNSGVLRRLGATSFTITDADSNAPATFLYNDVAQVQQGKEYIGEGSERHHYLHIPLWVPVVVGAAAAGAAVTAFVVR